MSLTGILAGPIAGLKYRTPTESGLTTEEGEFRYRAGERVAFFLGGNPIGSVVGASRVNLAQLVSRGGREPTQTDRSRTHQSGTVPLHAGSGR